MTLTYAEIAEIIKLIDASSCEEITLDVGEIKLSMRRRGGGSAAAPAAVGGEGADEAAATPGTEPPAADGDGDSPTIGSPRTEAPTEAAAPADGLSEIRSPMVGTFYRAPSPTSPPFVEVGDEVREDDPLCLIEVMKLYTTISATGPGRVAEIRAENGAMVGADEILFLIAPP